jgi:hypothetical protein
MVKAIWHVHKQYETEARRWCEDAVHGKVLTFYSKRVDAQFENVKERDICNVLKILKVPPHFILRKAKNLRLI